MSEEGSLKKRSGTGEFDQFKFEAKSEMVSSPRDSLGKIEQEEDQSNTNSSQLEHFKITVASKDESEDQRMSHLTSVATVYTEVDYDQLKYLQETQACEALIDNNDLSKLEKIIRHN